MLELSTELEAQADAILVCEDEAQVQDELAFPTDLFVVVHRRSGFRRLHMKDRCTVSSRKNLRTEVVETLTSISADAVCRDCLPYLKGVAEANATSSSSASSSSEETPRMDTDDQGAELPGEDD